MVNKDKDQTKKIYLQSEIDSILYKYDIKIILEDLENEKGFTIKSIMTGRFYIFINDNLTDYKKLKTLMHELKHIELGHLECFQEDRLKCEKVIRELGL